MFDVRFNVLFTGDEARSGKLRPQRYSGWLNNNKVEETLKVSPSKISTTKQSLSRASKISIVLVKTFNFAALQFSY